MKLSKYFFDKNEISDIIRISSSYDCYINIMTGKRSKYLDDVVTSGKRFTILDHGFGSVIGLFLKYDDIDGSLHVWSAKPVEGQNFYWHEDCHACIRKDCTSDDIMPDFYQRRVVIDICGQSIINFKTDKTVNKRAGILISDIVYGIRPFSARQEILKFVKNSGMIPFNSYNMFRTINDILQFLNDVSKNKVDYGQHIKSGIEYTGDNCSSYDCGEIPGEFLRRMKKIGQLEFEYSLKSATKAR